MGRRRGKGERREADVAEEPAEEPAEGSLPQISGYRILRKLATGARSHVYLGHDAEARPVVLKLMPRAAAAAVARELAIASVVESPTHLVVARDVSQQDGVSCLVLPWMACGSLTSVMERPQAASLGEAVTVVVSLVRGLSELHAAGYAHGRVALGRVLVDSRGRPALAGLGGAAALSDATISERSALLGADFEAAASVARELFDPLPPSLERAFDGPWHSADYESRLATLESELFAIADPVPLRLASPISAAGPTPSPVTQLRRYAGSVAVSRPGESHPDESRHDEGQHDEGRHHEGRHHDEGQVDEPLPALTRRDRRHRDLSRDARSVSLLSRFSALRLRAQARIRRFLRGKRRQLWFGAAVASAVAVVALALIPPQSAGAGQQVQHGQVEGRQRAEAAPELAGAMSDDVAGFGAGAADAADPADAAVEGDDPVVAAAALLARRDRCLATASLPCLEDVDQHGSKLLDDDRSAVAAARAAGHPKAGSEAEAREYSVSLIDRTGGSALVSVTSDGGVNSEPASLLLVRGEAGWRLREFFGG